jgi:hypothetical protein
MWLKLGRVPVGQTYPEEWERFSSGPDGTPPSLAEALQIFLTARDSTRWIETLDEDVLLKEHTRTRETTVGAQNVGTRLIYVILHTWFHAGEINSIRQMLGHPEIKFVGSVTGRLEWRIAAREASLAPKSKR